MLIVPTLQGVKTWGEVWSRRPGKLRDALDCLLVDFNGTVGVSIEEVYSPQLNVGDCLRTEAQRNLELFNSLQHTNGQTQLIIFLIVS